MEKNNTLQKFFEGIMSKIIDCFLSKNSIFRLQKLNLENTASIHFREDLRKLIFVNYEFLRFPPFLVTLCLTFWFLIQSNFANAQVADNDLTHCYGSCNANDFTALDIFLSKAVTNGGITTYERIEDSDCASPVTIQTYISFIFRNNSNSDRNGIFVSGTVNGNFYAFCFPGIVEKKEIVTYTATTTPITWTCGTNLILINTFLGWGSAGEEVCNNNCTDSKPTPAKCRELGNFFVNTPLTPKFSFSSSCSGNNAFQTVDFTNETTGGYHYYDFSWDFGDGTPISTLENPSHTYSSAGSFDVKLTITDTQWPLDDDGNPITTGNYISRTTKDITIQVNVAPCCDFFATCNPDLAEQVVIEGCDINVLPTAFTNPADVFNDITDNPCGDLVLLYNDVPSGSLCPDGLKVARTYTLFDDLNDNQILDTEEESVTCVQNFKIVDTTAPTITGTLTPIATEGCGIAAKPDPTNTLAYLRAQGLTISDACGDGGLTVTSSDGTPSGTCPITLTRTYTVKDACLNEATATQTITIDDTHAPTITGTLTPIATEGCGIAAKPAATNTLAYLRANGLTISDACGDSGLTVTSSDGTPSGTCPITLTRTYTVKDACLNEATATQTITIDDTHAPTITGTLTPIATEGCGIAAKPAATNTLAYLRANGLTISDACGDSGLTVTSSDGTPSGTCPITLTRTYTVKDACLNEATATQTITIDDTHAPTITGTLTPIATEGCGIAAKPDPTNTLAYLRANGLTISDTCGDSGLTVTSSDGTPSGTCPITLTRTYTVKDACLNEATATQTITIDDTHAPTITGTLTPIATEGCGIAAKPDPTNTLAYLRANGLTISDTCGDSGLTVTSSDGTPSGTCPITLTRTYTVKDACLNEATATQTITIDDTHAPTITGTLTPIATEGCGIAAKPAATNTLAYLRANGLTISDACGDGGLTVTSSDGNPSGTCPITLTRTYTVKDACLNEATATQTITIDDTHAPTITGTLAPIATEGCGIAAKQAATNTLAYLRANGLTISDACGDGGLTVTSSDGSPTGTCPITLTRTYTVKDACLNETTATQTITIDDTHAPTITGTLAPIAIEGCGILAKPDPTNTLVYLRAQGLTIFDACGDGGLTVTSSDGSPTGTCPITLTRTYTIKDACLNETTATQTITIDDTTPPTFIGNPINKSQACGTTPIFDTTPTASDNCDTNVTVTYVDTQNREVYTRTWTATDDCGNSSSKSQIITIANCGHLFPTGTTCCSYKNGSAKAFTSVCYTVGKGKTGGIVSNATPGVFFYYAKIKTPGTAGGSPVNFCINITQESPCASSTKLGFFAVQKDQITLWDTNCDKAINATVSSSSTDGSATICVTGAAPGVDYVLSVKYDTKTIVGKPDSGTCQYTFTSKIGTTYQPLSDYVYVNGSQGVINAVNSKNCQTGNASSGVSTPCTWATPPTAPLAFAKTTETVVPTDTNTTTSKIKTEDFTAYPVPFKDQLTIRYNFDYPTDVKIEVFDAKGKVVITKHDTNGYLNKEISLNLANTGQEEVYLVKVTTNRGSSIQKVISSR